MTHVAEPLVLGIETSCDETAVGIVRGGELLANVISSSMELHRRFGGVVPEVAARAHLEALPNVLNEAVEKAGIRLNELDAVAVTSGPGLAGALMVGVGAAKGLAHSLSLPLYAVNHLVGHVSVELLRSEGRELELPTVALLVSGGHTSLLLVRDIVDDVTVLGDTIDDAAGEAFDKVARLLGLPYPGGPEIDRVAKTGNPHAYPFPRGLTQAKDQETHRFNFSFSGLKTSVARWWEKNGDSDNQQLVADVAASFQEAVADVLIKKAIDACQQHSVPRLVLGGGVAANSRVRELAAERCAEAGIDLRIPPLSLCTDNGAMIAALGAELVRRGKSPSDPAVAADSTLPASVTQASMMSSESHDAETVSDDTVDREEREQIDEAITGLQPTIPKTSRGKKRERTLLPRFALSASIFGLVLAPAYGVGAVFSSLSVVLGHLSLARVEAARGISVVALVLGYVGLAASTVVGVIVAIPLIEALLVAWGFLLP